MMTASATLYFLSGPTAVGKTVAALDWAEANQAEIVSCDAVQFYRGMDIGSAKPTMIERSRVPHHLIDCSPPGERFTVGNFQDRAKTIIDDILARNKKVLITGGSGFYLSSFFEAFTHVPAPPAELRQAVRQREAEQGLEGLQQWLRELDERAGELIDMNNPRRIARAIERCIQSRQTLAEQRAVQGDEKLYWDRFERQVCLLDRTREDLHQRISRRVRQMITDGLADEVRDLSRQGLAENPSAARAIGYRETLDWLEGRWESAEDWAEAISTGTRRLARKQVIWFRKFFPVAWEKRMILAPEQEARGEELVFHPTAGSKL